MCYIKQHAGYHCCSASCMFGIAGPRFSALSTLCSIINDQVWVRWLHEEGTPNLLIWSLLLICIQQLVSLYFCNLLSICCASDHANPHFLVVKDGITVDRLGSFAAKGDLLRKSQIVAVNCCNIPPEVNHSIDSPGWRYITSVLERSFFAAIDFRGAKAQEHLVIILWDPYHAIWQLEQTPHGTWYPVAGELRVMECFGVFLRSRGHSKHTHFKGPVW